MKYYSTNNKSVSVGLRDAVIDCMSSDGGLYMPEGLPVIPRAFINNMSDMSLQEIAYVTTNMFFGADVDSVTLKEIVDGSMTFEVPLVEISDNRYVLELFHGPTMAFKDLGAGFMSRLVQAFNRHDGTKLNVLVATTGNTGAAVASGFSDSEDVNVFILYPHNRVAKDITAQMAGVGSNIHAIEVGGNIDDCKAMMASAFADVSLRQKVLLTSANSVNFARLIPQIALFFHAFACMKSIGVDPTEVDIAMPSGNLSMLTSGLLAKRAGLDCGRLIAACNSNNSFDMFLKSGCLASRPTVSTLARFMDMSSSVNLPRIMALCDGSVDRLRQDVGSATVVDALIERTMCETLSSTGYIADPHTAVGLAALDMRQQPQRKGLVFATAHPLKSADVVEKVTGRQLSRHNAGINNAQKRNVAAKLPATYPALRKYILSNQ